MPIQDIIPLAPAHAVGVLAAGIDRFRQFAPVLDIDSERSSFLKLATAWIEARQMENGIPTTELPAGHVLGANRPFPLSSPTPVAEATIGPEDGEWTREFHRLLNTGTE
jgi:hypothetical protein